MIINIKCEFSIKNELMRKWYLTNYKFSVRDLARADESVKNYIVVTY